MTWQLDDIPDQTGRTILVTGCTIGGLGHQTSLELARRGAQVILAGRNEPRLRQTEAAIVDEVPTAELRRLVIDLADLASVRRAVESVESLDVLVNNAGIMAPAYSRTVDGFESQLGTNHFGPFLLTGLLLPLLRTAGEAGHDARVVTVSSQMHRATRSAPLGDPRVEHGHYLRWPEYAQSKLANLLFTFELDRRLREADIPVRALAAHPGFAGTHLVANGQLGRTTGTVASILETTVKAVSQSPADGALPTLMAVTADLPGATYCGPSGLGEARGAPRIVGASSLAHDADAQRRLWELSEEAVGLSYP
ncbi:MAG: oxidoreductase [Nocardioides sp.]|uniref:oxidoreductase n=1 Tax=Nocardioides sp. TaxID=35761 RepID=UPI0039E35527